MAVVLEGYENMGLMMDPNIVPLRTLLSSRIVASAFLEKVGTEMVTDNIGITTAIDAISFIAHQCYTCRSSEFVSFAVLFAGIIVLQNNAAWFENVKRIESVDRDFVGIRKNVSNFVWILLIVLTKNIENAI